MWDRFQSAVSTPVTGGSSRRQRQIGRAVLKSMVRTFGGQVAPGAAVAELSVIRTEPMSTSPRRGLPARVAPNPSFVRMARNSPKAEAGPTGAKCSHQMGRVGSSDRRVQTPTVGIGRPQSRDGRSTPRPGLPHRISHFLRFIQESFARNSTIAGAITESFSR